ncbi:uncharacterized protein LOC133806011 [Humulus lupulus]|uniref:uncharacterized protein LOC133806011 n=1 Tax=Humulus lupulus TaxID=3486 RepID=UPI002B40D545|nr:uncharacterized protein LOC133806011 [Humulus lupulus]
MVLESGVVHFDRKPVLLRPWSTDLDNMSLVKSVPVWIRLPDLGLQYWGIKSLSALVSTIDRIPQFISFINERGQLMEQVIEFEWLPTHCSNCKNFGHSSGSCKCVQEAVWRPKKKESGLELGEFVGSHAPPVPGSESLAKDPQELVAGEVVQKGKLKEASCSTDGQEMKWTTPKKVGGNKQNATASLNLRTNKYSVLQENHLEVSKKSQQEVKDSNGRVQHTVFNKVGLGAFLETKLRGNKIEEMMRNAFMGWDWISSPTVEGRILLVWKADIVTLSLLQEDDQFIHCYVKIKGVSLKFCLTLIVVGDFNAVFDYDDRIGGRPVTELEVEDGRHWRACSMMTDLQRIIKKLKRLKPILLQFNKLKVGDAARQFSEAKMNYKQAHMSLQQNPLLISLQQAEKEAFFEFGCKSRIYESFLRQMSKISWLRFGDENTAYFHASLKQRKIGNQISSFMNDEGQIIDKYAEVVEYFFNRFKGFLGRSSLAYVWVEQECFQQGVVLTLEQQLGIIMPFTKKDVKRSLFSIHSIKSPGLDGYGSGFYKSLWKDIGDEISEAILMFFLSWGDSS